jgi:putative integral membrane protein (TIGR02587 family)
MSGGRLGADRDFLVALARALAGAMLFGLPLLLTMEMWTIGFAVDPLRLALFLLTSLPLLVGLAWYAGFRQDVSWRDAIYDALVACLIGAVAAAVVLALLGVLQLDAHWRDHLGKIAVQLVPTAIGATLARGQLGQAGEEAEPDRRRETVAGELFLMVAGAIFLAFNIAPTEEVALVARQITPWHALVLVALTVIGMHAIVYGLDIRGQHRLPEGRGHVAAFVSLSISGYVLALLTSAWVLWVLGRLDGLGHMTALHMVLVLGLPAGLGAATARVVL